MWGRPGHDALEELKSAVKSKMKAKIANATAKFYTIIPHAFGRSKPPLISTMDEIDAKVELLNTLAQIEDGVKMRSKAKAKKRGKVKVLPHPSDQHYEELEADLTPVGKGSNEMKIIEKYLEVTSGGGYGGAMKLQNVWTCNRHDEDKRFAKYDKITNRRLLWHGTNVAVVAAILKSGLRIMPHSGGRVRCVHPCLQPESASVGIVSCTAHSETSDAPHRSVPAFTSPTSTPNQQAIAVVPLHPTVHLSISTVPTCACTPTRSGVSLLFAHHFWLYIWLWPQESMP